MIWLRRVLAIPLIIIFVLTFTLVLLLTHLSGTVGSAGFYNGQMRKAHVYTWVYDNLTPAVLDETGVESPTDFPIDTPQLRTDIIGVARQTFPPEWLQGTFENATRKIVPYVMGDKNSFTITIDVQSRIGPMADGIKGVVDNHTLEIYDYVTDELIAPAVTESLGSSSTLPYGISLTDEEIKDFVADAMPQDWAIAQFGSMIDSVAAYLKGDINNLSLNIGLADVKARAATSLTTLADQKLMTAFNGLPTCTESEFLIEVDGLSPNTLPDCRPSTYSYADFKLALQDKLGMTIAEAVDQNVVDLIPNSYQFNDAQLREALGEDMTESLDNAREFIVVDQGRITDQDLRKSNDSEPGSNGTEEDDFDNVRPVIHAVRTWLWAMWLIPILLLVAIGFLCGRNWKSRLLWPLGVLFVTSLILVTGVAVARTFVPDRIVERDSDATASGIVLADKVDEIAHNAINAVVWGLEVKLILIIVLSGLAIAGVIAWAIVDRNRRRRLTQYDPNSPAA
jgi:hypothetical protein